MKTTSHLNTSAQPKFLGQFLPAIGFAATLGLSSCAVAPVPVPPVAHVGVGYWETVPADFVGDAFFVNGRYYYGGFYEEGDFIFEGRHYPSRYMHDGHYYYGGRLEHRHMGPCHAAELGREHAKRVWRERR